MIPESIFSAKYSFVQFRNQDYPTEINSHEYPYKNAVFNERDLGSDPYKLPIKKYIKDPKLTVLGSIQVFDMTYLVLKEAQVDPLFRVNYPIGEIVFEYDKIETKHFNSFNEFFWFQNAL